MSKPRAVVKDIRASFEARNLPKPAVPIVSIQPESIRVPRTTTHLANANMNSKLQPFKASIDSVIVSNSKDQLRPSSSAPATSSPATPNSTPARLSTPPLRPPVSPRPSWIGPKRADRPLSPGVPAMKQPVTIDYASPGLQPPVFIFTSLSDPQWEAVEMDQGKNDNGEFWFFKHFDAEEGEYQYKFRLGPGDWWAFDSNKPLVDDGEGNQNNLLIVKPLAQQASSAPTPLQSIATEPRKDSVQTSPTSPTVAVDKPESLSSAAPALVVQQPNDSASIPLMPHEMPAAPPTVALPTPSPLEPALNPGSGPLLGHELVTPPPETEHGRKETHGEHHDGDFEPPLLQHETLNPNSTEQTQAPLLRHESIGMIDHHHDKSDSTPYSSPTSPLRHDIFHPSSAGSAVAPEADPNDPTLERFPTDQHGILEHIRRASTQLPQDPTVGSPVSAVSDNSLSSTSPVMSLPSVQEAEEEDDDEALQRLYRVTAEQAEREADTEDSDPLAPAFSSAEAGRPFHNGPITPPMTPKEAEEIVEAIVLEARAARLVEDAVRERRRAAADDDNSRIVYEAVQQRGLFGTLADVLTRPLSW